MDCRRPHRLVNEGGFGLFKSADGGIDFTLPEGKVIPAGPDTRFRGYVVALRTKNEEKGLNITPRTSVPKWYGDKMDHQMAVISLIQNE